MRILLAAVACMLGTRPLAAADVDYVRDIKPILQARCVACHGAIRQKAGLRLDAGPLVLKGGKGGPVVVPGKPEESALLDAVEGRGRTRMPPEKEGEALSAKQIALLRDWIAAGAKTPSEPAPEDPRKHWAYQVPVRPPLPAPAGVHPVDAFLNAAQAGKGLTVAPLADKATLLRRVYLDLVGLPPAREELHAFLNAAAPDAYEKVVDRLLASPAYGERWGRHWMDVWRYSDPFGLGEEYRYSQRHIWRWRDWIVESLNADKGYDQMIVEMLAGDEIAPLDRDILRATGYLARNWYKFNRNVWIQDTVEYTAAGFLGVTLRCARCHDHKYDPISQEDYYRFRAFFEPHDVRIDPVIGQPDTKKDGVARVFDAKPDAPTYLFQGGDERAPLKDRPLAPGVPAVLGTEIPIETVRFTTKDYAAVLGATIEEHRRVARRELAAAADDAGKREIAEAGLDALEARIAAEQSRYSLAHAKEIWEQHARDAVQSERKLAVVVANDTLSRSERTLSKLRDAEKPTDASKKALAAAEQQVAAAKKAHAAAVAAAAKSDTSYTPLVRLDPAASSGRRLALARWIADAKNPLTARVAVNHVWMRHFGQALVASTANLGLAGKKPSHPELLDWLAVEFMENGWHLKPIHRILVTSQAYRLSSRSVPESLASDAGNRFYWRMTPRRMEAEVVRDSLLAVAGQLDRTLGGPILDEKLGQTSRRRSLYFRHNTEYKMQFLDQFDAASPTECYERNESILPQQALALGNSVLALNQSRLLARKLHETNPSTGDFITASFEQVLTRRPTTEEQARCEQFLREQSELFQGGKLTAFPTGPDVTAPSADAALRAREDLVQVLFNHNDFVTIR